MNSKRITTEQELEKVFHIRKEVFVREQGVPVENEIDEFDVLHGPCEYVLVYYKEKPVGTGRFRIVNGMGKLERICVLKPYRKFGLGKIIMDALEEIAQEKGVSQIKIHGQTHAEGFYEKLGYEPSSEIFMEEGIPHVQMIKKLNKA